MTPGAEQLLVLVAELDAGDGVALAKLAKRLDTRVSVLLRLCAELGPGRVGVQTDELGHWRAFSVASSPAARKPR